MFKNVDGVKVRFLGRHDRRAPSQREVKRAACVSWSFGHSGLSLVLSVSPVMAGLLAQ